MKADKRGRSLRVLGDLFDRIRSAVMSEIRFQRHEDRDHPDAAPLARTSAPSDFLNHRHRRYDRWMIAMVLAPLLTVSACAMPKQAHRDFRSSPVIKLRQGAVEILPNTGVLNFPVLSADGKRLAVDVETYRDALLPYEIHSLAVAEMDQANEWLPAEIVQQGIYKKYLGRMSMPVQPSFDHTGDHLFITQIRFFSALSVPWASTVRSWIEKIPWRGGAATAVVKHDDWGLKRTELLQHARLSPDGKWLTFYTRVHPKDQGVHLMNLETGERYRLSHLHDKHPTWSPDGKRIYFHQTRGGKRNRFDFLSRGEEQSVLGYFELSMEGNRLLQWKRHLMDAFGDGYVYHKHPTEIVGMNLLFFHGKARPDGKTKLMVRSIAIGSPVYVVQPYWKGRKVKEAKHPCSSFEHKDLVFVAKPKGESRYRLLMSLTPDALERIRGVVFGESQPKTTSGVK